MGSFRQISENAIRQSSTSANYPRCQQTSRQFAGCLTAYVVLKTEICGADAQEICFRIWRSPGLRSSYDLMEMRADATSIRWLWPGMRCLTASSMTFTLKILKDVGAVYG